MSRNRPDPTAEQEPEDLAREIHLLRRAVDRFNDHSFVRVENSLPRLLFRQFLRGLALGLGTVVGASVLVSTVVYLLSQIDFIPILGEWANEIANVIEAEVEARRGPDPAPEAPAVAPDQ